MRHCKPFRDFANVKHFIAGVILLIASGLLLPNTASAADVNVLIIGSTEDALNHTGDALHYVPSYSYGGLTPNPFDPTAVRSELENILKGVYSDPSDNVNVQLIDRAVDEAYYNSVGEIWTPSYAESAHPLGLAEWFSWTSPPDSGKTRRWPNLRGELGTEWDYVVLIGDSTNIELLPGLYNLGVNRIAEEVAASTNETPPETVLLLTWPASAQSTLDHYKEVVYRTGRTAGIKVAPAGLAWQAAGLSLGATHPTADGAYIAAASLYSRIWNANANTSSYTYGDGSLADTVYTTVTNNVGAPQYTGVFTGDSVSNTNNIYPFKMNYDQRRQWGNKSGGFSSCWYLTDALKVVLAENLMLWPGPKTMAMTRYEYQWKDWREDGFLQNYYHDVWTWRESSDDTLSEGVLEAATALYRLAATASHESDRLMFSKWLWMPFHKLYPDEPASGMHISGYNYRSTAAFAYTSVSGRCPLGPKPDPVTKWWNATRIGYEAAWQMGTLQSRAPYFKTQPASALKLRMAPGQTETLTSYFVMPPPTNVTVNVSIANSAAASVSPTQLIFTPENYATPQSVVVTCLSGAATSAVFDVAFDTVSADEVCDGLHQSWQYTRSFPPEITTEAWADSNTVMRPETAWVNVTATDPEGDALIYSWSKVSGPGTVSFSPNVNSSANRSEATFSAPGSYILEVSVSDGAGTAISQVTVESQNLAPVADAQSLVTPWNSFKQVMLTGSDGNGDTLTYTIVDNPANGVLFGTGADRTYIPNTDFTGSDSFTFKVSDGFEDSASVSVTFDVRDTNVPPVPFAGADRSVTLATGRDWTPDDLPATDRIGWYDATDAATILTNATTGAVTQWNDKSGNGFNLTAKSGPTQASINGKNAIDFASGSYMENTTNQELPNNEIAAFIVFEYHSDPSGAGQVYDIWCNSDAKVTLGPDSSFMVPTLHSKTSAGNFGDGFSLLRLMSRGGNVKSLDGRVGEFILLTDVSEATRLKMEGYLAHKWGLTASLPENHPYKIVAPGTDVAVSVDLDDADVTDADSDPIVNQWSIVSVPANTAPSFNDTTLVNPTVTFDNHGTYVFRLTSDDGFGPVSDEVTITVNPNGSTNQAPIVFSESFTTRLSAEVPITLRGVDNNGDPLTYRYTQPVYDGTLSGTAPNLVYTTHPNFIGTDSFTFVANDGSLDSAVGTVTITVSPNVAPTIVIDYPKTTTVDINSSSGLILETTVTDDGTNDLTITWQQTDGTNAIFETPNQEDTAVHLGPDNWDDGTFTFRITASDGELTSTRDITVNAGVYSSTGNIAPQIGPVVGDIPPSGEVGQPIDLLGSYDDDDLPNPPGEVSLEWQLLDYPGTAVIADPTADITTVTGDAVGEYILRLIGNDGEVKAFDDTTLTFSTTNPTYAVSYNGNGNTGGTVPEDQVKAGGVGLTLAENSGGLVRYGYLFDGWNTAADGSGTDYAEGALYTADAAQALYAKWIALPFFHLTLINGSGEGSYVEGEEVPLVADTPPTGYRFDKWTGVYSFLVADVDSASTTFTMPPLGVTITARYVLNNAPEVDPGDSQSVVLPTITDPGPWTPTNLPGTLGWYDADDAATLIMDGSKISKWNDKSSNNRHLSAARDNQLNYIIGQPVMGLINGRDAVSVSSGAYFANETYQPLPNNKLAVFMLYAVNSSGYIYGFCGKNDYRLQPQSSQTTPTLWSNVNTYPMGDGIEYLRLMCRTGNPQPTSGRVGEFLVLKDISDENYQRVEGYLAHKWGTATNLPAEHPYLAEAPLEYATVDVALNGSVFDGDNDLLTTTWSVLSQPAGSRCIIADPAALFTTASLDTVGTYTLRLSADDGMDTRYNDVIMIVTDGSTTDYSVAYNGNGNTGGTVPETQTKEAGVGLTLATNSGSLVRDGYTFEGWNTASDGSGSDYAEGATYSTDANLVLYAKWAVIPTYALTVNSGTGDGAYTAGTVVGIFADAPLAGYRFGNWTTSDGGTIADANAASTTYTMPANAATLTANYVINNLPTVTATADPTMVTLTGTAAPPATSGYDIFLDATLDDGANTIWEDSLSKWNLTLGTGVNYLPDAGSALPGISAAYDFPGGLSGDGGGSGTSLGDMGGVDTQPITLELWFKPDASASYPSNGQVLWETGGGTGFGIFYNNGFVEVAHDSNQGQLSADVSALTGEFIQVVVTYDPTSSSDNFNLYINGNLQATGSRSDGDMCGGDGSGLGQRGESHVGGAGNSDSNTTSFDGKIAVFRSYHNQILTATEVETNYNAIAFDAPSPVTLGGTVSDLDGDSLATTWSVVSTDPAGLSVTIDDASAVDTTATFYEVGTYTLRLTADDSFDTGFDEVVITVTDGSEITSRGVTYSWLDSFGMSSESNDVEALQYEDPDGDGLLTWQEYYAGTDPTNAASQFKVLDVRVVGTDIEVIWYGTTNGAAIPWSMYMTTNPAAPDSWAQLETNSIPRDPDGTGTNRWSIPLDADGPKVFYRPGVTW